MPKEERQLFFQPDEFIVAVRRFHELKGELWGPRSQVAGLSFTDFPEVTATLRLERPPRVLHLNADMMIAALIVYCIQHRIPLPAEGHKSVRVIDGRVELFVTLVSGVDRPPRPDVFRTIESEFLNH